MTDFYCPMCQHFLAETDGMTLRQRCARCGVTPKIEINRLPRLDAPKAQRRY